MGKRIAIIWAVALLLSGCKCDKPSVKVVEVFDITCRTQCGHRLCQVQTDDGHFPFVYDPQVGEVYSGCDLNPACKTMEPPTSGTILVGSPSPSPCQSPASASK